MTRQRVICGNWKMYKTVDEAIGFIKSLAPMVTESQALVYLAVPYTVIYPAAQEAKNTTIVIGAQNMNDATEGAFTGEIAGKMLKEAGAKFVIIGHSERRLFFGETDEMVNKKVLRALKDELQPIVCIGETLQEREEGSVENILERQLTKALANISESDLSHLIIAYEPVWAIGTDRCATPEIAQNIHAFCRKWIANQWGSDVSENVCILYGGSVKPDNISALMAEPDIDGVLVGTASLKPEIFSKIVNFEKNASLISNHGSNI